MKLIILAAGKGERLWPLTKTVPKSLLSIGRRGTLLGMQLAHGRACGVDDILVVIGYRGAQIEQHLEEIGDPARTLFNPFFDVSNNLISAWLARHEMTDEMVLLNGDVVFRSEVLQQLLDAPERPLRMVIDRKPGYDDDDMKVTLEGDQVVAVSKTIPAERSHAESIGMIRFSPSGARAFAHTLETMARNPDNRDVFYLAAIQELCGSEQVAWSECGADDWAEVDFHPDLRFIKDNIRRFDERVSKWGT